MARIDRFEDIEAWQQGRVLTAEIYALTREREFARDFALRDQIRRSSISVMANIAEGFERNGNREFARFLHIAKASAAETRAHLYVALDASFITSDQFNNLSRRVTDIARMLSGLITYLERSINADT